MLIIPAIDIIDGKVVRLVQGRRDKKVYSKDPVKTARHWERQGAKLIHVVDLDGATSGTPKNLAILKEIVKNTVVPVQFGGGIRTMTVMEELFASGVRRLVLGTKAAEDIAFLKRAYKKFKDKIIVSLDAKDGHLLIKGWQAKSKNPDLFQFALGLKEIGFKQLIFTDTSKDGTLKGPNLRELKKLISSTGLKVIASGGISSLEDIYKLKLLEKEGVSGVIVGKALYEGRFTLSEAMKFS